MRFRSLLLLTLHLALSVPGLADEKPSLASYVRDLFSHFPPSLTVEQAKAKWENEWNGRCRKLFTAPAVSCHLTKFPVPGLLSATLYAEDSGKFWNIQLVLRPHAVAHDDVPKFLTGLPDGNKTAIARQAYGKAQGPDALRVKLGWGGYLATTYPSTGLSVLGRAVGEATYRASSIAIREK